MNTQFYFSIPRLTETVNQELSVQLAVDSLLPTCQLLDAFDEQATPTQMLIMLKSELMLFLGLHSE